MNTHSEEELRDYFAAKAMQAIIAKLPCELEDSGFFDETPDGDVAACAYIYADAMMRAREDRA